VHGTVTFVVPNGNGVIPSGSEGSRVRHPKLAMSCGAQIPRRFAPRDDQCRL